MISSTIIPTIGRTSLSCSVNSVLQQDFARDEFEVIVVNDSGKPLLHETWMDSEQVTILHTNRLNRCVARNTGVAVARGKYLHFLDDDDWMLPGAFAHLWRTASSTHAAWICGGFALVNNDSELIGEVYPRESGNCFIQMIAFEWLPLQASWIDHNAFIAVGGFDTLFSTSGEDIDLSRRIARYYDFAHSPALTAKIRFGDEDSTTEYGRQIANNRLSREKSLDLPGAFDRLRASAQSDGDQAAYWHGRIIYYYLASVRWNILQKNVTRATRRARHFLLAWFSSGRFLFSRSLWKGLFQPHFNRVRRALGLTGDTMFRNTSWKES